MRSHPEPIEREEHWAFVKHIYIPRRYHEGGMIYTIHVAKTPTAPDHA